jgi:hypothetical protein
MVTVTAMTAMEAMMVMMATLGQVRWRVQVKYYSAMFSTDNAASWSKPRPIEGADPGPRRHQFIQKSNFERPGSALRRAAGRWPGSRRPSALGC